MKDSSDNAQPKNELRRVALIDVLRGYCLIAMTVNHLPHTTAKLFTWQTLGFVSAAEGFVFLSGLVGGMAYGGISVDKGLGAARRRIFGRMATIYLTHVIFLTLSVYFALHGLVTLGPDVTPGWALWRKSLLFLAAPSYTEILRLYFILLLFVPVIFWCVSKRYSRVVIAASALLWGIAALGFGTTALVGFGYFDIVSWQALFIAGIFLGHPNIQRSNRLRPWRALAVVCAIIAASMFLIRHGHAITGREFTPYFFWLAEWRHTLSLGRLVNFAAIAYLIFYFRAPLSDIARRWPATWVGFLGRHSFPVFLWSVSTSMIAYGSFERWRSASWVQQNSLVVLALLSCYVPAWLHHRWQLLRNGFRERRSAQEQGIMQTLAARPVKSVASASE